VHRLLYILLSEGSGSLPSCSCPIFLYN
jgi:hypothetical protein